MPKLYPWLLTGFLVVGACSDANLPETVKPRDESAALNLVADAPTEWPLKIHWVVASIAMPGPSASYPASARLDASMYYDSYRASIGSMLYLRGTTTDTRT